MDDLQVPSFIPDVQRYFGHFTQTLRSLALQEPRGTSRQILYFIGLFPNLQDLKLCYNISMNWQQDTVNVDLSPLSVPPLCGRLTLVCFTREKLVKDMITFEDTARGLESVVEAEGMNGGFYYLSCEPLIISEMRSPRARCGIIQVGAVSGRVIVTSAL